MTRADAMALIAHHKADNARVASRKETRYSVHYIAPGNTTGSVHLDNVPAHIVASFERKLKARGASIKRYATLAIFGDIFKVVRYG